MSVIPDKPTGTWKERNREKLREIQRKSKKKHYAANREKLTARRREWYKENKELCKEIHNAWRVKNKDKQQEYHRIRRLENIEKYKEYDRKRHRLHIQRQNESASRPRPDNCEFCDKPGPVVFDHDHRDHEYVFRSWPCKECNTVLGLVKEQTDVLRKMADFLDDCESVRNKVFIQGGPDPSEV